MYIFILSNFYRGKNKLTPNPKKKGSYSFGLEHNFKNSVIQLSWNEICETRTVQRCYYYSKTLDDRRNRVWSEGKVCEMFWTMVALGSDQRAKLHYSLIKRRTKVRTMVVLGSDQRAKSEKLSEQRPQYGLIRGQSLGNGLDNGRNKVWSERNIWEMFWEMIALGSD